MSGGSIFSNVRYAIRYLFSVSRATIFLSILSAILSPVLIIFNLYIIRFILSALERNSDERWVLVALAVSLAITLFIGFVNAFLNRVVTLQIDEKIHRAVNLDIYHRVIGYSLSSFDDAKFYDDYYFIMQHTESSMSGIVSTCRNILSAVLSSAGLTGYLISTTPSILAIVLTSVGISCAISIAMRRINYKFEQDATPARRKLNYINRIFYQREYGQEIRSYPNTPLFTSKYEEAYQEILAINLKYGKKLFGWDFLQSSAQACSTNGILLVLVTRVFAGIITISDFVVSQNGSAQLGSQISAMINSLPAFYEYALHIGKTRKFLTQTDADGDMKKELTQIDTLTVEHVSFHYDRQFYMKDISLTTAKGKKIAIVGRNGAGKSTLAKLMGGFYRPQDGRILINGGVELGKFSDASIHQKIGFIFQDYQLFAFSIAENILMHPVRGEEDRRKVTQALKLVGLHEKVMDMPLGMDTCVSKEFSRDGAQLSGGELQRLALARIYAQDFDVIIFDELTSALDPYAEESVYRVIEQISKDKIVFFISHRLVNMPDMDEILYMEEGRIAEHGTHMELMQRAGKYAQMYLTQASKYNVGRNEREE